MVINNNVLALGATLLISVIPNLLLFFIPYDWVVEKQGKSNSGINVSKCLLSFASGGLLGDVFLHSVPDLLVGGSHHHHHHHHHHNSSHDNKEDEGHVLMVCLNILAGFFVFLIIEKIMKIKTANRNRDQNGRNGGSRGRSTSPHRSSRARKEGKTRSVSLGKNIKKNGENAGLIEYILREVNNTYNAIKSNLSMTGYLNLVADSMHNFTDGLAIGASFAGSQSSSYGLGIAAFLAVMFHEIPHEIGDFTILVKSGLTKTEAIRAQFVTAVAAFAGTATSLVGANSSETVKALLLAWTNGGFLYIATVSMIPTVLEPTAGDSIVKQGILEAVGFILGVVMMLIVMQLE